MELWLDRVAVVTGASAGIGADICKVLVKHGVNVAALGKKRRQTSGMCVRESLKIMKTCGIDDGHIININSTAGHRLSANTGFYIYSAAKVAAKTITEGLRRELVAENSKIKVTNISPGGTNTEFFDAGNILELASQINLMESMDVAEAVLYTLATPVTVQVNELIIRSVGDGV